MTDVHQWGKMNVSALIPCFSDHLTFVFDVRQMPLADFSKCLRLFLRGGLHGSCCESFPCVSVGLNNTTIFCLVLSNCTTRVHVLMKLKSTKRCRCLRNFQLSTNICHCTLEFFIIKFKKKRKYHVIFWNRLLVFRWSFVFSSVSHRTMYIHQVVSNSTI